MTPNPKRWEYCDHPFEKLRFFSQHYRCRKCGRFWPYPHLIEARNHGTRAIIRLEDLELERAEVMRRQEAKH